jgi:uncharacterized protein YqhQ
MRGPKKQAIVVRTPDGLVSNVEELRLIKDRYPILGWPIIRGVANFLDSMVKGVKALMYSAELLPEEQQEEPSKLDRWIEEKIGGEKAQQLIVAIAVALGIGLSIGLFILLPTLIAGFVSGSGTHHMVRNLLEGLIRIVIFLFYLWACTRMKDIQRVFAYHGAEHKAIFCYEKGLPLTVENVRAQPRRHPRCGTSFLFVVMIISILVFSVVNWTNVWVRMGLRILLLPVVVGISYEINRWVGRHDNLLTAVLSWPGRMLQHLTTNEPDDSMIEVAIEALTLVIPEEKGADAW